jgi:hypothetical protein
VGQKNKERVVDLKYFDDLFLKKQINEIIVIIMAKCPEGSYLGRKRYWIV